MLIGLCGFKRAGKDTVAAGLVERYGFVRIGFADALRREVEEIYGLTATDAEKDAPMPDGRSYRDVLIEHGMRRRKEDPDYWVKQASATLRARPVFDRGVVFSDCRFPNELRWVQSHLGVLVWVQRDGVVSNGHITERDWSAECSFTLHNDMAVPSVLAARVMDRTTRWMPIHRIA
ncbi:MAG TPA: hypothetical protein VF292_03180 [Rhodanobacteraceae bacterium]